MHFHVTRAFKLFENDFIHSRTGVHKGGRDDGEGTAFFDVTSRAEEPFGLMQRVGIDTAGENFA